MSNIKYKKGDVANSGIDGLKILPHIVNTRGVMGAGVAYAIATKWPRVENRYKKWRNEHYFWHFNKNGGPCSETYFELGENQFTEAEEDLIVVNMLAQKLGTQFVNNQVVPPIRLWALKECMMKIADFCRDIEEDFTITCPKFGSLRAGGNFDRDILPMIEKHWADFNVIIFEY